MEFPSKELFVETFGIEPIQFAPDIFLYRYLFTSRDGNTEIDLSFSGVTRSFQAVIRIENRELAIISSENVESIKLRRDKSGIFVHVIFEINGVDSEALVKIEPELSLKWWTLDTGGHLHS